MLILMILVLGVACSAPAAGLLLEPSPTQTSQMPAPGREPTRPPTQLPTLTTVPAGTRAASGDPGLSSRLPTSLPRSPSPSPLVSPTAGAFSCAFNPGTDALLEQMTAETWMGWVEKLSGAQPVTVGGEETVITTRYSPAMFSGQPNARAFEFVLEQVQGWYPEDQIEVMPFKVEGPSGSRSTWKNLILTLPGQERPEEMVLLTAHLDSTSSEDPERLAPGAEDNASGSATLLEAARLFRDQTFDRTIQIIWFTGEEQGLFGSRAYAKTVNDPSQILGVINLDMFGYDSDQDRCFELHVGTLTASDLVGQCFVNSIDAYDLDLEQYDYLRGQAIGASDHSSFWDIDVGAIEVLENMFDHDLPGPDACDNGDHNPHYHSPEDTADRLNPESALRIARAALAAAAGIAIPVE